MESLNLNNLANSLPTSNLANAEKELTNNFKAAALSLTTLYRSSRRTSKRAYNAGYASACQDLLFMIQQGVSAGESSDSDGQGMTIGRIMDYLEARLEAIKSREEEEDEDEEKEKERDRGKASPVPGPSTKPAVLPAPSARIPTIAAKNKDIPTVAPLTPYTPPSFTLAQPAPATAPASPTPLPLTALRPSAQHSSQSLPLHRTLKGRLAKDPGLITAASGAPFSFDAPSTTILNAPDVLSNISDTTVGAKRRHNVMMLDTASVQATLDTSPDGPSARRRTRSARGGTLGLSHQHHPQDQNMGADAMDVEDEGGRERKRVARR